MMSTEQTDIVERLARKRARLAIAFAAIFVTAQAGSFDAELPLNRPQLLHVSAWIVWAGALLFFLMANGALLRGAKMRAMLNDETTLDHRRRALVTGFWLAIGTAFLVYALSFYEPMGAREAARLVITFAIAGALLRFGTLERRALTSG